MTENCPLCRTLQEVLRDSSKDGVTIICHTCGKYRMSGSLFSSLPSLIEGREWILSGKIRNRPENDGLLYEDGPDILKWFNSPCIDLHTGNLEEIIKNANIPNDPIESLDRLLLLFMDKVKTPADYLQLRSQVNDESNSYPLLYCRNVEHFDWVINTALDSHWLEGIGSAKYRLTPIGWQRAREIRQTSRLSNQAFIASWFGEELDGPVREGIIPVLRKYGYKVIWMKELQHNEPIDDRIFAEIRRSSLMVADFTGMRSAVFYEAGFAAGLSIPVIFTCKGTWREKVREHFDTRQINHIFWSDSNDLSRQLTDRIGATISPTPVTPDSLV